MLILIKYSVSVHLCKIKIIFFYFHFVVVVTSELLFFYDDIFRLLAV